MELEDNISEKETYQSILAYYKQGLVKVQYILNSSIEKKENHGKKIERAKANEFLLEDIERNLLNLKISILDEESRCINHEKTIFQMKSSNMKEKIESFENQTIKNFALSYLNLLKDVKAKLSTKIQNINNSKISVKNLEATLQWKNEILKEKIEKMEKEKVSGIEKEKLMIFKEELTKKLESFQEFAKKYLSKKSEEMYYSKEIDNILYEQQILENNVLFGKIDNRVKKLSSELKEFENKLKLEEDEAEEKYNKVCKNEEEMKICSNDKERLKMLQLGTQNKIESEWLDLHVKFLKRKKKFVNWKLPQYENQQKSKNIIPLPSLLKQDMDNTIRYPLKINREKSINKGGNYEEELEFAFDKYKENNTQCYINKLEAKGNKIHLAIWKIKEECNTDALTEMPPLNPDDPKGRQLEETMIFDARKKALHEKFQELLGRIENKIEKFLKLFEKLNKKSDFVQEKTNQRETVDHEKTLIDMLHNFEVYTEQYFDLRGVRFILGEIPVLEARLKLIDQKITDLYDKKRQILSEIQTYEVKS